MQCPRCNARIAKTSIYCNNCGAKISGLEQEPKTSTIDKSVIKDTQPDYIDEVIDTFIGTNKETLKKGKFSAPAFFFGPLYYYFRKMYIEGTILLIIRALIYFFGGTKYMALNLCISLYSGFTFKKHYINHVKEESTNIINYNITGKKENALLTAYNKGGTTAAPIIVVACIYVFAIFALLFYVIVTEDIVTDTTDDNTPTLPQVEHLSYDVPSLFTKDTRSTEDYALYSTKDKYCNFYITKNYLNGYSPDKTYGPSSVEHLSNEIEEVPEEILINGYMWEYNEVITKTNRTYNLSYEGEYIKYNLSFFYITDASHEYCEESYQELKDSLKLE